MSPKPIPEPTLRRLPAYCHHLRHLASRGIDVVPCTAIGRDLGLDPSQIRKDLENTGIAGKPRVGYSVPALVSAIEQLLGWNRQKNAILAGAESLGQAILSFDGLEGYGLRIVGVFDSDERLIGTNARGREVRPLGFLTGFARALSIQIGIITLPAKQAQMAADLMVAGGVRAIWNLAALPVRVPEGAVVENHDFRYPLAVLSSRLARVTGEEITKSAATGGKA